MYSGLKLLASYFFGLTGLVEEIGTNPSSVKAKFQFLRLSLAYSRYHSSRSPKPRIELLLFTVWLVSARERLAHSSLFPGKGRSYKVG